MPGRKMLAIVALFSFAIFMASCGGEVSSTTGTAYNDPDAGGFEKPEFVDQETGPGLVFIEGGSFVMGRTETDLNYEWNNEPRKVSVSSFYMDETEVTNLAWTEYLYWLSRVYGADYPEIPTNALPDTLCWRTKLGYAETYVKYYLRHPAYRDYPVVGVSWLQANNFCKWRTDRVNENILIRQGLFENNPNQINDDNFSTDSYLTGQFESGKRKEGLPAYDPNKEFRNVGIQDGILLPEYRLPTEAEWEYAALGLIGESFNERIENRKIYPWSGNFIRNDDASGNYLGDINDNFVRGRGDMMGIAGALNDGADITANVYKYFPNDFGLYSMAGNVSEWVMDVYRPLTSEDAETLNPFRGNVYRTPVLTSDGLVQDKYDIVEYDTDNVLKFFQDFQIKAQDDANASGVPIIPEEEQLMNTLVTMGEEAVDLYNKRQRDAANEKIQEAIDLIKDSETVIAPLLLDGISDHVTNVPGQLRMRDVKVEENTRRINYKESDNIDFQDGDLYSSTSYSNPGDYKEKESMYHWRETSLIDNRARVYKGGSWADRAFYCSPATRRFLDERMSSNKIGFRCAMARLGDPVQNGQRQ